MQVPVEICYAGVVVARAQEVREVDGSALFIVMKEPLPVGTLVDLRSSDSSTTLRVAHVVETADGVDNGMHVRPVGADDSTRWIPPPPAKPASPPIVQVVAPIVNVAPPAEVAPARPAVTEPAPEKAVESVPEKLASVEPKAEPAAPASAESAAVPVSVPVESSGKRRKKSTAVQMVIAETSAPAPVPEPPTVAVAAPDSNGTPEKASEVESSTAVSAESSDPGEAVEQLDGDLPPARPIQGANGRRRTKRRR